MFERHHEKEHANQPIQAMFLVLNEPGSTAKSGKKIFEDFAFLGYPNHALEL